MDRSDTSARAALDRAAYAVSSAEGDAVFRELVRHLASTLAVDLAFIALPTGADGRRLRMLAFCLDGKMVEDFEYPCDGTPCETVLGQTFRLYPDHLCERFPLDADFRNLGLECYAGYPLAGTLGLIAVASREQFAHPDQVESLLKIFAARAVTEIERRRAAQALQTAEASYRAIFEAAEDAIFVHDWDTGAVIDVNPKACEVYGYRYEELKRISIADLGSGEPPYTGADAIRWIERAKQEGSAEFEWHRRNRDGSLHWDEVRLKRASINGKPHVLAFTREITERKRAEADRVQLEAQLRQAQKMEAIGHLTGGIAHDFNNILTSILGYVALAADRPAVAGDAKLARYLDQSQVAVRRARDLIQQMLTFSRGQRGDPRPVALEPLVRDAMSLMRSTLPATMELDTRVGRDLPWVMLDPIHLEQVLLNLCINARDAMGGSGAIEVDVSAIDTADAICASCRQRVRGRHVQLSVRDTGPGIAPDVLDRMFEPFYTTKDVGKGSGMGLATVHGIVHEYGGHVCVDTALGCGAAFRILLPPLTAGAQGAITAEATSTTHAASAARLTGRVLVVDDEEMVGAMMGETLDNWGLETTVIRNPIEAEQWFVQDPHRVDLVITDQTMPKLTGLELAQRLTLLRPDLPVLLYTGYGSHVTADDAKASGICALFAKPVEPAALFELLREHLPQH